MPGTKTEVPFSEVIQNVGKLLDTLEASANARKISLKSVERKQEFDAILLSVAKHYKIIDDTNGLVQSELRKNGSSQHSRSSSQYQKRPHH